MTSLLGTLRCTLLLFLILCVKAAAQDTAEIFITITDPSDAVVPGAHLTMIDSRRGTVQQGDTNSAGVISFQLTPSDYTLDVTKTGFAHLRVTRIALSVRDRQSLRLPLTVATETTVVTVNAGEGVATDASLGVSLNQDFVQNLPLNGRNADSLILMVPGVTSAAGGIGGFGGGFNANGLRSNLNYFTLDGVSVNSSISGPQGGGPPGGPGGGGPGAGPPSGGTGSSTNLISIDAMQEIRVQTSPFAPEFGRSPGAQVSMTSRSGSNAFHGSAFYYFRNERLNANDWFANSSGYHRSTLRQNRPGGTFGGPLQKNKTFFFISYEKLKALIPTTVVSSVPDLATRASTPASVRTFVNAFPLPNGPQLEDGAAQFNAVVLSPSNSESASVRLDQAWSSRTTLFLRYSTSRSNEQSRSFTPSVLTRRDSRSDLFTGGWTKTHSATLTEDLRVNFSNSTSRSASNMDTFGGAVPLTNSVFPKGITSDNGQFTVNILGVGSYSLGGNSRNDQKQVNTVYSITKTAGAHIVKLGVDYRRTMPTNYRKYYSQSITFNGLSTDDGGLLSGIATNVQVSSNLEKVYPLYTNFSAYAQDTFRATDRTTITYGLRWEVNPAPGVRQGPWPFAINAESAIGGVTQNEPLYATKWLNIAPRFGLAYQADTTEGRELMLRMGFGFFYDVGYGSIASSFAGAPYSSVTTISSATLPLSASDAAPPALPPGRPYGQVSTADSALQAPIVSQYNFIVERSFGRGQQLSVGYVGTLGRRLMRTQIQPSFGSAYDLLMETTNGATSSYNGLQVQFRKRLSARMQVQLSYTYGHSIDSSSNDAGFGGGFASLFGGGERGSSDYDVRHNLSFSGSYRLPAPSRGFATFLLRNWFIDWVATARTGLPFDVQGVSSSLSDSSSTNSVSGIFAQVRPDYTGKAVWIDNPSAPGGRRLNPAAFSVPDGYAQGNLGRNVLRGFGASQVDISLRRQIPITEHLMMNISAQAFNATNHPNFANLSPQESNLSSPNFGVVTRMLNQASGGTSSLYASGGPRSIEIAVRFQF